MRATRHAAFTCTFQPQPPEPERNRDLVACVLAERGDAPGLVHVILAMESCPSFKPWLDKSNGHAFPNQGLHHKRSVEPTPDG